MVLKQGIHLFNLDDIADGECKSVSIQDGSFSREVFGVRQGEHIHVYANRCPHTGAPLDWQPEQFLNLDRTHIQCATHHALFRIEDGFCIAGPCAGQSLQRVAVSRQGQAFITEINGKEAVSAESEPSDSIGDEG